MAERTFCPACGAPLEILDEQESVQCAFCNDRFTVQPGEDRPQLRVESQPGPQKDVLSGQADRILGEVSSGAQEQAGLQELRGPQALQGGMPDSGMADVETQDGPDAPPFATFGSGEADPTAVGLPDSSRISGAQVYDRLDDAETPATLPRPPYEADFQIPGSPSGGLTGGLSGGETGGQSGAPAGKSRRGLWIGIGVAVFVVMCILCSCLVGALMIFSNNGGGGPGGFSTILLSLSHPSVFAAAL